MGGDISLWFLIFICLMSSCSEHLFMYLLDICVSSLEKCLFTFSAHLGIRLLISLLLLLCESFIFWILASYLIYDLYIFFFHLVVDLFILLLVSFAVKRLFSLTWSHLRIFCFSCFCFSCHIKKWLPRPLSRTLPLLFSSRSSMVPGLLFHFKLVFIYVRRWNCELFSVLE